MSSAHLRIRSALLLAAALIACGGCTIGYAPNIRYLPQDGAQCIKERYSGDSCIIEIPQIGYLNVIINTLGSEQTEVTIRLAPNPDVEVRWASQELVLVDLENGTTTLKPALPTQSLRGKRQEPPIAGYLLALYGPFLQGDFHLQKRIGRAELRLPDIVSSAKVLPGIRFRYDDGPRAPVPVPLYHSH